MEFRSEKKTPVWFFLLCVIALTATVRCFGLDAAPAPALYIYSWENYFSPNVVAEFEKQFGCHVEFDYYDSMDTMLETVLQPGTGYDLFVASSGMCEALATARLICEIDHSLVPNIAHIGSRMLPLFPDPEMRHHVPYTFSAVCIGYNSRLVTEEQASKWSVFGLPGFEKRAAMLSDMRYPIGAALKQLGYSVNSVNADEIAEAVRLLKLWKKNIAQFSVRRARKALVEEEFVFIQTFDTRLGALTRANSDLRFVIPDKGSIIHGDVFACPVDAANLLLAHAFINFMIEPANAAANMDEGYGYMPNPEARKLMRVSRRDNPTFHFTLEQIMNCESIRHIGDARRMYEEAWEQVLFE